MSCQQEGSGEGYPGKEMKQPGPADEHGTGKLYLGYCQCGYEPGALSFEYTGDDLLEGVVGHGCLGKGQQQGEGEVGEDDSPDDGAHLPGEDKGGDVGMEEIAREEEEGHKDIGHIEIVGDDLTAVVVVGFSMEEQNGHHADASHLVHP